MKTTHGIVVGRGQGQVFGAWPCGNLKSLSLGLLIWNAAPADVAHPEVGAVADEVVIIVIPMDTATMVSFGPCGSAVYWYEDNVPNVAFDQALITNPLASNLLDHLNPVADSLGFLWSPAGRASLFVMPAISLAWPALSDGLAEFGGSWQARLVIDRHVARPEFLSEVPVVGPGLKRYRWLHGGDIATTRIVAPPRPDLQPEHSERCEHSLE